MKTEEWAEVQDHELWDESGVNTVVDCELIEDDEEELAEFVDFLDVVFPPKISPKAS